MNLLAEWIWRPWASPLHIFAGVGVVGLLAGIAYARTMRQRPFLSTLLLAVRLAVIAALAVVLMGPSDLPPPADANVRPKLTILLDRSGSMQTADCPQGSRIRSAIEGWLSPARRGALAEHHSLRLLGFDEVPRELPTSALAGEVEKLATGRVSRVAACVTKVLLQTRGGGGGAAMVVFSDGRDTDGESLQEAALLARARNVPIYTVCFGGDTMQRDLKLVALPRQEYLLAGEEGQIVAKVFQAGFPRAKTTLHLRSGDRHVTRPVEFDGKPSVTIPLPVRESEEGLCEYRLSVDAVPGEQETSNNQQHVFCRVTAQRIRVLLLEGDPYWDTKFLAQSLRKDGRIELTQITQLSPKRRRAILTRQGGGGTAPVATVPQTADALAAYEVIILGHGVENVLPAATAGLLADYVSSRGGQVLFARGRAYDPATPQGRQIGRELAVIEPVIWGRGTLRNQSLSLTPAGRANPCFSFAGTSLDAGEAIFKLPGFTVMPVVQREKTTTHVLARAAPPGRAAAAGEQGEPAICVMNYGSGKVVAILGEGLWQWSFLPPALHDYDGIYDAFCSNLIRWLATGGNFQPGAQVALKLSRSSVRMGDPMLIDVACKFPPPAGNEPTLTVTDPAGKTRPLPLTAAAHAKRLQARFTPKAVGVHALTLDAPTLTPQRIENRFNCYDIDVERLNTAADPAALALLATQSGGKVLAPDQGAALAAELTRRRASRRLPQRPTFLWDKAIFLILLLGWIGLEWLTRRRAGLL